MNVYSYINLELGDRGWHRDGETVFHKHETGTKYKLEVQFSGIISVIENISGVEVDIIPEGEYDKVNKYNT